MRTIPSKVVLGLILFQPVSVLANAAEEMSAEIIAVQIRDQGYSRPRP